MGLEKAVQFGFFTTGFSLTGTAEIYSGIGFILMCVFFNIVNVIMEEGTFRGLLDQSPFPVLSDNKNVSFAKRKEKVCEI